MGGMPQVRPGVRPQPLGPSAGRGPQMQYGGGMQPGLRPPMTNLGSSAGKGPMMSTQGWLGGGMQPPSRDLSQGGSRWTLPGQMGRNLGPSAGKGPMMNIGGPLNPMRNVKPGGQGTNLGMPTRGGGQMGMFQGNNPQQAAMLRRLMQMFQGGF